MELYDQLDRTDDPLAQLFHGKLHTATRKELVAILGRRFFKEYELRFNTLDDRFSIDSNPDPTLDKARRKKDVNDLVGDVGVTPGILWRRLLTRVDAALENRVPTSTELPALPSTLRDTVKRLSDAQLELFREWFPDGKGGINFPPFQRVFEQFTNGELRDPSVTGHLGFAEPGTGAFFLFAEFAFLCIELNFDKSDWEQTLRTFIKIQEIFMHVYRENPKSPPPPVGARLPSGLERRDVAAVINGRGFHFANFKQVGSSVTVGKGQSDLRRKLELRAKYDRMDMSTLKKAARDNLWRALRMP
jgi:hypothetical protein